VHTDLHLDITQLEVVCCKWGHWKCRNR